jgi:hypothetical protein
MQGENAEQRITLQQLVDVFLGPAAPPDLAAAAAGCVAQRLALLTERAARLRYSCPAPDAANAAGGDAAAPGGER